MKQVILTGCDSNTEWQLPWFLENLWKHNPEVNVIIANFGMTYDPMDKFIVGSEEELSVIDLSKQDGRKNWFKKPEAMVRASELADKVVWMDTDCEVLGDISQIFDLIVPNTLGMIEDRPWSRRRPDQGRWFNSGVVAFEGLPDILPKWRDTCMMGGQGDQETLHEMFMGNDILKMKNINQLPHRFNTLRLDIADNIVFEKPLVVHWTGPVGKQNIKRKMGKSG